MNPYRTLSAYHMTLRDGFIVGLADSERSHWLLIIVTTSQEVMVTTVLYSCRHANDATALAKKMSERFYGNERADNK